MVGALFNSHKVVIEDRNPALKAATESLGVEEPTKPRYSPTPEPIHYPVIPSPMAETQESHAESVEPSVPEQDDFHGLTCSESLMENSDGWEYAWYTGGKDDPIPVYDSEGDGEYNPNLGGAAPAAAAAEDMVIDLTADTAEPMEVDPDQGYPAWDDWWPSDTSVTNTSDVEYIPPGRPYAPDTLRRTTRYTGWTPGCSSTREEQYELGVRVGLYYIV